MSKKAINEGRNIRASGARIGGLSLAFLLAAIGLASANTPQFDDAGSKTYAALDKVAQVSEGDQPAAAKATPVTKQKPKAPLAVRATANSQPVKSAAPVAQETSPGDAPAIPEKINGAMPAWTASCVSASRAAPPDCRLEQRLFAKETGRLLSAAVIFVPGATRQPSLVLQLPNGLALKEGVSITIDEGTETPLPLESCDGNGCYGSLALVPSMLDAIKAGKVAIVKATLANGEHLTLQHLLVDFSAAFESIK